MAVAQYEPKFAELARFAPHMIQDEIMKVRKFEIGLKPNIRGKLVALRLQSYSEIVETACLVEQEMLDSQSYREKGIQNQKREGQYKTSFSPSSEKRRRVVSQFGSVQNPVDFRACYSCEQMGHMQRNCPHASVQSQFRPPQPYRPVAPVPSARSLPSMPQ